MPDAIPDVLADDPARADDRFIGARCKASHEREVAVCRESAAQCGRGLQVCEEDRGCAAGGLQQPQHSLKQGRVACGEHGKDRATHAGLPDRASPDTLTLIVV
jgi:hypothetical protein